MSVSSPSRTSGDIENLNQHSQHSTSSQQRLPQPFFWILPSVIDVPFCRLFLATMGWYVLGQIDVKDFLDDAERSGDWEKHNARFRDAVCQITTAQGLVLGVCAAFMTTVPPVSGVGYTSGNCYTMFCVAFLVSIAGLVYQLLFFQASQALSQQPSLPRDVLLDYIELFCLPQYALLWSLAFLAIGLLQALLGPGFMHYFELVIPFAVILAALFTSHAPGTITLTRRFADIMSITMIVVIFTVGYKSSS